MTKLGMVGLAVVLLIGSLGMAVLGQTAVEFDTSGEARAVAALIEAHIGGLIDAMHTMATTAELRTGDWDEMVDLIAQFEEMTVPINAWFLLPDGSYYKVAAGLTGINLSDRAYFARVMAGETTFDDLVVSRSTGRKSLVLTAPILADSSIIGALGVTLYLDDFSQLLSDALDLPHDVAFYAVAGGGVMPVHSDIDRVLASVDESGIDPVTMGSAVCGLLGWTVFVGRPVD